MRRHVFALGIVYLRPHGVFPGSDVLDEGVQAYKEKVRTGRARRSPVLYRCVMK